MVIGHTHIHFHTHIQSHPDFPTEGHVECAAMQKCIAHTHTLKGMVHTKM